MAKKYSKIFTATVTFGDNVTISETKKASIYAKSPESKIEHPDGQVKDRTVMIFGDQLNEVQDSVFPGNTVELAVQYDGGTVKVIGYPNTAPKKQAA